jgi:DNA repair protein RecO (recombination protein O)
MAINGLLDALDDPSDSVNPDGELATAGLRLLGAMGWGLDLERCVRCGRPCADVATACIDPQKGGLICRACGGALRILRPDLRRRLIRAVEGDPRALHEHDISFTMDLVEAALAAHAGEPPEG